MRRLRPRFPPHVAEVVRGLPPDVKTSVKAALRTLCADPEAGDPLEKELEGLWRYRVRRFRIVYRADRVRHVLEVLAVAHRRTIYEELAERERPTPAAPPPRRRKTRK